MKYEKKLGILLGLAMSVALALAGCGGDGGAASNKDVKILLVLNQMDSFRETLVAAARTPLRRRACSLNSKMPKDRLKNR